MPLVYGSRTWKCRKSAYKMTGTNPMIFFCDVLLLFFEHVDKVVQYYSQLGLVQYVTYADPPTSLKCFVHELNAICHVTPCSQVQI